MEEAKVEGYLQNLLKTASQEAQSLDPLERITGHGRVVSKDISGRLTLTEEEIKGIVNISLLYLNRRTRQQHEEAKTAGNIQGMVGEYKPTALKEGREKIPAEIGRRFEAHGIARGTLEDQIVALDNLLTNGVDRKRGFSTTVLRDPKREFAQYHLYDFGGFIVVGPAGGTIMEDGITAVLVNEHFVGALPIFRRRFPHVTFISANDLPSAFQRELG